MTRDQARTTLHFVSLKEFKEKGELRHVFTAELPMELVILNMQIKSNTGGDHTKHPYSLLCIILNAMDSACVLSW